MCALTRFGLLTMTSFLVTLVRNTSTNENAARFALDARPSPPPSATSAGRLGRRSRRRAELARQGRPGVMEEESSVHMLEALLKLVGLPGILYFPFDDMPVGISMVFAMVYDAFGRDELFLQPPRMGQLRPLRTAAGRWFHSVLEAAGARRRSTSMAWSPCKTL